MGVEDVPTVEEGNRTVTRATLYAKVWSKAVRTVAAEYGISNIALAKVCRKLDVPRPPVGYWARLLHGQTPRRTPLPPRKAGTPAQATIRGRRRRPDAEASGPPPREPPVVPVPTDLLKPHPAVRAVRKARDATMDSFEIRVANELCLEPKILPLDRSAEALSEHPAVVDEPDRVPELRHVLRDCELPLKRGDVFIGDFPIRPLAAVDCMHAEHHSLPTLADTDPFDEPRLFTHVGHKIGAGDSDPRAVHVEKGGDTFVVVVEGLVPGFDGAEEGDVAEPQMAFREEVHMVALAYFEPAQDLPRRPG